MNDIDHIIKFSKRVRKNILDMSLSAGSASAHFGGAMSSVEIVSSLYCSIMNFNKDNYKLPKRDRFTVKGPRKGLKINYVEQIEEIVATITVQKGKFKIGDALKAHYSIWGWHDCKVSRIYDENGEKVKFAKAGQTVSITGFYKLFSTKHVDINKNPIDGKKFETYDDSIADSE